MTLLDLFVALDKPSGRNRFALGPQICAGARLAKSSAGHPAVLVAVKRTGASAPRRLANLEYDPPRKLEVLSKAGKARIGEYATLECPSKDEHVREMFLRFVSIFLEPGDSGLNEGDLDLRLDALVALFRSLSQPSEQTIQGLWAKLAVIAWSTDVKTALSSWHSSPRNLHDFGGGADRLEVKSAGVGLREHAFRLEQLGEQPNGRTLIASVVVEEVEIGQSVAELVEVILAKVDNDGESRRRLETIVARSLGENWRQSGTLKFDLESARRTLRIYDARAVPSVHQPLPTEIKHVHFVVDLSTAPSLALMKARKLGALFTQLLPQAEMTQRPIVISLFSGAGGLDYGFEAAGYKAGVCVKLDSDCCATLRGSRPRWNVIERTVFDVTTKEMLTACGVPRGHVDVVIGGPPCQPFSKSGYWASGDSARLGDPRADTLSAFLRVVEEARPKAFLLENVVGLMYAGKDEGLQHVLDGIKAINHKTKSNYQPTYQVVNAADFGVPQIRERVFIVASRDGSTFNLPAPTHGDAVQGSLFGERALEPYRTAWDALGDRRVNEDEEDLIVRGKWAELLPSVPEGMNYLWHTDRGVLRAKEERQRPGRELFGWRRRYWSFLLKLAKRLPSWTIQAQPGPACGPFHWSNRRLSNRELCRIQTFPENVKVRGGKSSAQKQIGNAVPSLMGEILGREIKRQLLGISPGGDPLELLPKRRSKMPSPERYTDVPKEFRPLEGRHDAHPGTGLGNGALLRELNDAD